MRRQLEEQFNAQQTLELEMEQLKGKLVGEDDVEVKKLRADLKQKIEELEHMEELNTILIGKERKSDDEVQEVRKALIGVLRCKPLKCEGQTLIGVRRMGSLDVKAIRNACRKRFAEDEAEFRVAEFCADWHEELCNPNWHPFKIVCKHQEPEVMMQVIDEEDEKLVMLKAEWGDELCKAVTVALIEMNEYNPSGGFPVEELWNFKEDRKATVVEAIQCLLKKKRRHKFRPDM